MILAPSPLIFLYCLWEELIYILAHIQAFPCHCTESGAFHPSLHTQSLGTSSQCFLLTSASKKSWAYSLSPSSRTLSFITKDSAHPSFGKKKTNNSPHFHAKVFQSSSHAASLSNTSNEKLVRGFSRRCLWRLFSAVSHSL